MHLIENGIEADFEELKLSMGYRSQPFHPKTKKPQNVVFFNRLEKNRFTPNKPNISTMYFGFTPETAIFESHDAFRNSVVASKMRFGKSELLELELITFKPPRDLKLLDLSSDTALMRHRLKLGSPILTSTNTSESRAFSDKVLIAGFDGILYPTRQGARFAAVVFSHARDKMETLIVKDRTTLFEAFEKYDIANRIGGISIIDDTAPLA